MHIGYSYIFPTPPSPPSLPPSSSLLSSLPPHRIYSLDWIVKNCTVIRSKLGEELPLIYLHGRVGVMGAEGYGVMVTVNIRGS